MKPILANAGAFVLGCAAAAAVWSLARPTPAPGPLPEQRHRTIGDRWSEGNLQPALEAIRTAKSSTERAAAAAQLARIPAGQIPDAIASATLVENRRLTAAAKVLLVRWAETD